MRDTGRLPAQPVGGVLRAELMVGHDLQSGLIGIAGFGQLNRLAEHPLRTRPAIGDVPDGTQLAGCLDVGGFEHTGGVVEQNPQRLRRGLRRGGPGRQGGRSGGRGGRGG